MNELEAKCYLTKKGGANNSDHTCTFDRYIELRKVTEHGYILLLKLI